jgi:hypothetical protein
MSDTLSVSLDRPLLPPLMVSVPEKGEAKVIFVVGAIFVAIGLLAGCGSLIPHLTAYALPMQIGALVFGVIGMILMIVGYGFQKPAALDLATLLYKEDFEGGGFNLFHWGAEHGQIKLMRLALGTNCDINAKANSKYDEVTPLHVVARRKDLRARETIAFLLDNGAQIEARDDSGRTPLLRAVYHPDNVRFLLERGADINSQDDDGRTILHTAVQNTILTHELVPYLIEQGADVNAQDNKKNTPLHAWCLDTNYIDINREKLLIALLEANANPEIKNQDGKTPLDLLKQSQFHQPALIEKCGKLLDPTIAAEEREAVLLALKQEIEEAKSKALTQTKASTDRKKIVLGPIPSTSSSNEDDSEYNSSDE